MINPRHGEKIEFPSPGSGVVLTATSSRVTSAVMYGQPHKKSFYQHYGRNFLHKDMTQKNTGTKLSTRGMTKKMRFLVRALAVCKLPLFRESHQH